MDSGAFSFIRALNKLISNQLRAFVTIDGIVTAVNSDFTCDITINEVVYSSVPIKVLIGSQASIYEVPTLNSHCLVTFRDGNRALPQIVGVDQVDKYYISPVTELFISSPKIQFNNGSNGGLVLVNNLVTRMNLIENNQNAILAALKAGNIPSTPFALAPLFVAINPLNDTTAAQIQSTTITQ